MVYVKEPSEAPERFALIIQDAINGIDVTPSIQTRIDWSKVKAAGFEYVYIQSSRYSSVREPNFYKYVAAAQSAGLWAGAYHFCSHDTDPTKQAEFFYSASAGLGRTPGELPPLADWEFCTAGAYRAPKYPLGHPAHCVDWIEKFLERCDSLWGVGPFCSSFYGTGIYTFPAYANRHQPALSASSLGKRWLCYASYKPGPWMPKDQAMVPVHPTPAPWSTPKLVQYSGDKGLPVPGVVGACDRQVFKGTGADWDRFRGIGRRTDSVERQVISDEFPRSTG